ncbi:MAG: hypothetical protein K9M99_12815 [Candidatus Cloacimonetes bacterium]|nr:hypothetical protein [Candidatus Cloacimonadota bacterium]
MKRAILIILLLISNFLLANSLPETQQPELVPTFGVGAGYLYQFSVSLISNNTYYCFRHYESKEHILTDSESEISETAFLFGKAYHLKTKKKSYLTFSFGLSLNEIDRPKDDYNISASEKTIGIPFDINFTRGISRHFGYGVNLTANVVTQIPIAGMFLFLYLGDFTNTDYSTDPGSSGRLNDAPLADIKENSLDASAIPENLFSFDYNLLNYIFSLATSYNGSLGWKHHKIELILPFHCRIAEYNDIYNNYDSMNTFGLKTRIPLSKKIWFADLGLEILKVHHLNSFNGDRSYSHTIFNAAFSLGTKAYLSKSFYLKNQLNIHIPVAGDDLDLDVNDNVLSSRYHYIDFEFLSMGFSF